MNIQRVDDAVFLSYIAKYITKPEPNDITNFVQREKNHKYNCEYYGKYYTYANDNNVYGLIRNNGGWKNFKMVFVEKWPLVRINVKLLRVSNIGLKF